MTKSVPGRKNPWKIVFLGRETLWNSVINYASIGPTAGDTWGQGTVHVLLGYQIKRKYSNSNRIISVGGRREGDGVVGEARRD